MQSESTAHLVGTRFASEELEDDDGTESEIEGLSDDSEDVTAPAESLDDDDCSDNWDGEDTVGEWQDWRCKQVIEKMPGVSPLCNACKHLFGEYQPFDARYGRVYKGDGGMMMDPLWLRFLATLQALQFSAWSGCAFCKLVSAIIRRESLKFEPAETIEIKFRVRQRSGILTFTYMGRISPRSKAIRSDSKWLNILPRISIDFSNLLYLCWLTHYDRHC